MSKKGIMPIVVAGWIVVAWVIGIVIADEAPAPTWPRYGNAASWCRPHPYNKIAWKPWPFRHSRWTNEWREGDTDTCTGEIYRGGKWEKITIGTINQDNGLVYTEKGWDLAWWARQFNEAKAKGCHLEDSCGVFPPYYINAEYCGEPQTICPGQHWKAGVKR